MDARLRVLADDRAGGSRGIQAPGLFDLQIQSRRGELRTRLGDALAHELRHDDVTRLDREPHGSGGEDEISQDQGAAQEHPLPGAPDARR